MEYGLFLRSVSNQMQNFNSLNLKRILFLYLNPVLVCCMNLTLCSTMNWIFTSLEAIICRDYYVYVQILDQRLRYFVRSIIYCLNCCDCLNTTIVHPKADNLFNKVYDEI